MLFNSFEFIGFLIVIFIVFTILNRRKWLPYRNVVLLLASYYFYAQLNVYFVVLLVYVTGVNYIAGYLLTKSQSNGRKGKGIVTFAIVLSIGMLVFFKYAYLWNSSILLPIGLSFFTFQALTYTIDIYRGKIRSESNIINVALFVAFFPTLLSGPIERARNLIPQLKARSPISMENVEWGIQLFIYGLFKKVVIADRLADYVNAAYYNPDAQTGSTLAIAAIFYSFQIYCDFSGYADMAIGSGKILGFNLMDNFKLPYCASTIKEFWRRWHISLTSWFTEYVYISLGGNRVSKARWMFNISAVFLLSGIWHGATVSFVLWGALHALYYLLEKHYGPAKPNIFYHLFVFIMVTFAWLFFRIEDSQVAVQVIYRICTDLFSPFTMGSSAFTTVITTVLLIFFMIREFMESKGIAVRKGRLETTVYLLAVCLLGVSSAQFVYFQF